MASSNKILTASCHCKRVQFTLTIPIESLPLKTHLCHCSICRYTHGTPCIFHAPLPAGIEPQYIPPSSVSELTIYELPTGSKRHFCSTCGCHIGAGDHEGWVISNAIFDANKNDPGIWLFNTHYDPNSASDGGLSALFSSVEGRELKMIDPEPAVHSAAGNLPTHEIENKELLAQCHCGGVSFTISRPKDEFVSSPASHGWLPPDKTKWLACLDLCDDCRLVNGTHVIGWMFVPVDHLSPMPPANLKIGSSKGYRSSKDVLRTFCDTCGATVFYSCEERPGIVDVATGLLRAPEGVMAENWAVWRAGRASGFQDGLQYHEGFASALIEGMKQWGEKRGHPQDFIIP